MQRGDENAAPANISKKSDAKNIVSKLCAQYEVKTPRVEPALGANRIKKGEARTPKASFSYPNSNQQAEEVSKKSLRIDADRTSFGSDDSNQIFLSVTPSSPGPISPSRLPFKRIHADDPLPSVVGKTSSVTGASSQNAKKPKLKSGKKEGSDTVMTVIRFRPGGSESHADTSDRSAYVEDCSVVLRSADKKESVRYTFDEVCAEHVTQDEMFMRAAQKITDDFLEGYNATIFAYGQTGSGKTHTMLGDLNLTSSGRGITPRVFSHVFNQLEARQAEDGPFDVKVSFLQIYNEKCQDLLNPAVNTRIGHVEEDLKIRESHEGVFVEGLSKTMCRNPEQAMECVIKGIRNRKTGKTAMNTVSSRSHSILTIELTTRNYSSRLNLIDLAGSENQRTSAASSATQQTEANNINRSLTYLGQCLREAVKGPGGANHVNYRNSKLTKLLKDSLGGTAKTCVIATVSALPAFASETVSTLKFAANISLIQTQAIKNNVKGPTTALENEVARLKQELRVAESEAQAKLGALASEWEDRLKAAANKSIQENDNEYNNNNESGRLSQELEAERAKVRELEVELAEAIQNKHQAEDDRAQQNGGATEELKLALQTAKAENSKLRDEISEVQEDLRFMIEKETAHVAKAEKLERELTELRTQQKQAEGEKEEVHTIRRLVAEKADTATDTETINALQQEVLRLQNNSQKDLARIDELQIQIHTLEEKLSDCVVEEETRSKQLKGELEAKIAEMNIHLQTCKPNSLELTKLRFERSKTTDVEKDFKSCRSENSKLKTENSELKRQLQLLSTQLNQERNDQDELCRFARNEEGEKHRALLEKIEADFGGKLPLGNQARLFIRSGLLKRVSKHGKLLEYNFFLFTDVLIYASAAKSPSHGKFKAHRVIHLGLCRLVDIQPRPDSEANTLYSNSFRLITPQKSDVKEPRNRGFYISCDTPQEKQTWMTAIGSQIEKIYSQPEGTVVQVPRVADVSAPERMLEGDMDGVSMNARSSFSVCEEDRRDVVRSRESSLDFNEELKGESPSEVDSNNNLLWASDDPNRPRAPSNESTVSRSRGGSVTSSVFSRMTEFTAADLPASQTSLMRAKIQAQDYCRLCVRPFSSSALHYTRNKAVCGCCDDRSVCKGCCSNKAVPPRSLDAKERKVCLACHGGITKLIGRGIPRLSVEYE